MSLVRSLLEARLNMLSRSMERQSGRFSKAAVRVMRGLKPSEFVGATRMVYKQKRPTFGVISITRPQPAFSAQTAPTISAGLGHPSRRDIAAYRRVAGRNPPAGYFEKGLFDSPKHGDGVVAVVSARDIRTVKKSRAARQSVQRDLETTYGHELLHAADPKNAFPGMRGTIAQSRVKAWNKSVSRVKTKVPASLGMTAADVKYYLDPSEQLALIPSEALAHVKSMKVHGFSAKKALSLIQKYHHLQTRGTPIIVRLEWLYKKYDPRAYRLLKRAEFDAFTRVYGVRKRLT